MKRNITEKLRNELRDEFAPIIESDAVIDVWNYLEDWKKRVNGDIYGLASIMVEAFSDLAFDVAQDMDAETKNQIDLQSEDEPKFETKIIYLFEK